MDKLPPITEQEVRKALKEAKRTLRELGAQRIDITYRPAPHRTLVEMAWRWLWEER